MLPSAMIPDGPLRRDIHRVLDFRTDVKPQGYKPKAIDHRRLYSASLYEIASEHVSSICLLLLFSRLSSGSALLRSCIESAVRSTWLLLVASEENVQAIVAEQGKDKGWLGLEQMMGAIEAHHKAGGVLRRIFSPNGSLNDLCHGGVMQIGQRTSPFMGADIAPMVNRMCLRNAMNALALVTCAMHLDVADFASVFKVTEISGQVFAAFETVGDV